MENEYNILEEKLIEENISDNEKIRILERQKELLLQFLVDANKNIFTLCKIDKSILDNQETILQTASINFL